MRLRVEDGNRDGVERPVSHREFAATLDRRRIDIRHEALGTKQPRVRIEPLQPLFARQQRSVRDLILIDREALVVVEHASQAGSRDVLQPRARLLIENGDKGEAYGDGCDQKDCGEGGEVRQQQPSLQRQRGRSGFTCASLRAYSRLHTRFRSDRSVRRQSETCGGCS